MAIKIVHTGDIHIGKTFGSKDYADNLRSQLTEARFRVLERIVLKANQEICDLFVIAGDLFDSPNIRKGDIGKTANILADFNGKCLCILPGNHDYYDVASELWNNFRDKVVDNTLILLENKPYSLEEYGLDVAIYPGPCHSRNSEKHTVGWIKDISERPSVNWHIGVAHGALVGVCPDMNHSYYNMEEQMLRDLGLDLWLLAHSHVRYPDKDSFSDYRVIYCGTPEPDGFDCNHNGYCWIITLEDKGNFRGISVNTGEYRFSHLYCSVSTSKDLEKIKKSLSSENPDKLLLKLKIEGCLEKDEIDICRNIIKEIRELPAYIEIDDLGLRTKITQDLINTEFTSGSLPHRLLSGLAGEGADDALQIAYQMIQEVRKK